MKRFALCCLTCVAGVMALRARELPQTAEDLRPDQMAELSAASLEVEPRYPRPNEAVTVRVAVRNAATHSQNRIPISLFAGANRVAQSTVTVAAGATATATLSWTPPDAQVYVLTARIDPEGTLVERDRADNDIEQTVPVVAASPTDADFAVSSVDIVPDTDGNGAIARVVVANNGNAAARGPLAVIADGRRIEVDPVQLGAREKRTVEVRLAKSPATLTAEINGRDRGAERQRDDNVLTRDVRPAVDVAFEGLSASTIAFDQRRPRQITISGRVVNRGRDAVRRPFAVSIFPGRVRAGAAPALEADTITINELAAGATAFISRTIVSPVGEFDIRIDVDPAGTIAGDDRSNNVVTWHYQNPAAEVDRWVSIGPRLITGGLGAVGRLSAVAIDRSDPATIYVGAAGAGVWKTSDGAATWQPIADSFPTLAIAALAISPRTPSTVYAATAGTNTGVFRSDDGGASWQMLPNSPTGEVRWGVFIVSPRDANVLYMNASDGVHRSTDAGATWKRVFSNARVTDLVMAQGTPTTLYAGVEADGVYKTTDGGDTWTRLSAGLPAAGMTSQITLAICRDAPQSLYAGYSAPGGLQLFRTDDGGANWTRKTTPADPTLYNDNIGVDPNDPNFVYVTGINFWRSTDGGATWTRASGPHVDHHAFLADPVTAGTIYALSDGGIFKSPDRGVSWTFAGAGLTNVEFYDHAVARSDVTLTIGGTQDNGTIKYTGSADWTPILGGDGATVAIDPTDPNIVYAMNQGADSVQRATNGTSFAPFAQGLPTGAVCNNLAFHLHPRTRTTLLAPCLALWRTTTTTPPGDWQTILPQPPNAGVVVRSAIDPTIDLYYAGTSAGRILAGPGGANWQTVFTHPTGAAVTDIDVDPADPRRIFVSFRASGDNRVFVLTRSSNAPASMTARAIGAGIPAGLTVQTLAIDLSLNSTIYAGTTRGVFRGRASSATAPWTWSAYQMGMPPADVRDLEVHPTTGVLRAATYGRSAFEVNTAPPFGSVLGAEGRLTLLRAHDLGTGWGPPHDRLDVEAIVMLDTKPGDAFGLQLRDDAEKPAHRGMFSLLRKAFAANRRLRIDYIRTGLHTGRIIRVMLIP